MGGISVRVIAEDVMLHICLGTARNPAISVNFLLVLDQISVEVVLVEEFLLAS